MFYLESKRNEKVNVFKTANCQHEIKNGTQQKEVKSLEVSVFPYF